MTAHISKEMHNILLKKIKEKKDPLTLIIDSSHDSSANHICILLFQTLEDDVPVVHFYRALHFGARSRGIDYQREITKAFVDDDIMSEVKSSLVAWTSDGASNMLSEDVGAAILLSDTLDKKLYKTHCEAHRSAYYTTGGPRLTQILCPWQHRT